MKKKLPLIIIAIALLFFPNINFGQVVLGPAASRFALYTSSGAVTDNASAHSLVTGDVGTNGGGVITANTFGNVNGVMHNGADAATAACSTALGATITQITASTSTFFPAVTMGNGDTLIPGVYAIAGATTLGGNLYFNAQGNPNAQFIIKITGTFGVSALTKVKLINGALACNIFWNISGAISVASPATIRGNFISGGSITIGSGDSLEGRAFSTVGAILIDGITSFTPIGCGSPILTGPPLPNLYSTACYSIFSSSGALTNTIGTTSAVGDVGNNGGGSITGWTPAAVTGTLHMTQDSSTIRAAADLLRLYDTLNAMIPDIILLYPAQFGRNLTLTPHVYSMGAAATFTDSLYLDAQNNPNGVFVIKIGPGFALTTSTYSRVKLINGAQSKNVFWLVQGAVSINNYSIFRGTIVSTGAINMVNTGVVLDGRALTTNGAITTAGLVAVMPPGCGLASNITSQPINDTVCSGSPARFSVVVTGTSLTYQWRKGTVNLTNGGNISGATSDTLKFNPATISDTSSLYNVVITGSTQNDTSINVSLIVNTAPIIISQPANQTVCTGSSARFSVVAKGTALTYQWRIGNVNLINGVKISGATSDTLRINPVNVYDTASNYNVVITGTCSPVATSANASLIVDSVIIINSQPANQTACSGGSALFSVVAKGGVLTYQWRKGNVNLTNSGNISGATSDTLRINPVSISDTSSNYYVIISSACSPNDTSNRVSLIINTSPIITSAPVNQTVCSGSTARFSVVANGTGLTYQWRKGLVNLTNSGNISGATSDTLKINPATISDTATNYNVVISGTCSPKDSSINVSLIINTSPIIATAPTNQITCPSGSATFSVTATGAGLTYQWRKGLVNLTNAGNISGATSASLTINPAAVADSSSYYNVVITGTCSPASTSANVSLTVNGSLLISTAPANQSACVGSSTNFSVTATGGGLTYQWRKGIVNLTNTGNISGATTAILTINPVSMSDTSTNYNVVITGTCTAPNTSANVSLTVNTSLIITTAPSNQSACPGGSANFSVVTTGTGLTYQWRKGIVNLINAGNISGATSAILTINPASVSDTASNYNLVITSPCSPVNTSANVSLTVSNSLVISTAPANQSACVGSSTNFSVTASGGGLTYQWRKGIVNLTNTGNISGATTATLTINPVSISDTSSYYNVVISSTCAAANTSANVSLTVNASLIITTAPANQTACPGGSVNFSVNATGTGLTYQWRKGIVNLINGGNISGATTATLTINPVSATDTASNYNLVITSTCSPVNTSANVSLTFNTSIIITTAPANQTTCVGSSTNFSVTATGAGLTYQWRKGTVNLINGGNISGATSASLIINPSTNSDTASNYNVVISSTCSPNVNSTDVSLSVNQLPVAIANSNSPVCVGSPVNLNAQTVTGATYNWTGPNSYSSTIQNSVILSATIAHAGLYSLTVTNNGCNSIPATVSVLVNTCVGSSDLSVIKTVNNSYPIIGHTVIFTIVVSNKGPNDATGVIVTEVLQSGFVFISSTVTAGIYLPSTGTWTIDTLKNGASATLTITAKVNSFGSYVNTAVVVGNGNDSNLLNNNSTIVLFPKDFHIPEGFSPNGDGTNDLFVIRGIDQYPANTFTVYNRWGNEVFTTTNYQNTWDGTCTTGLKLGGDQLPVGTYFYVLDLGDGSDIFKGTIYLNK